MIPVFFNGSGDWFIEDCFGQSHAISELGGYLIPSETSDYYLRWKIYERCNYYDYINGSNNFYGMFKLSKEDELRYRADAFQYKKPKLTHINKLLPLLPGIDHDCAFSKMAAQNGIAKEDADRCYFKIKKYQLSTDGRMENINYTLHTVDLGKAINSELPAPSRLTPNKTSIRKRHVMQRHNEALELLHAALDEIELSTGKTPEPAELVNYVLGGKFEHRNIDKRDPESRSVTRRELHLTDGTRLDAGGIKQRYRETIFKN